MGVTGKSSIRLYVHPPLHVSRDEILHFKHLCISTVNCKTMAKKCTCKCAVFTCIVVFLLIRPTDFFGCFVAVAA